MTTVEFMRRSQCLNQEELAKKAGLGRRTIRDIEHGKDCWQSTKKKVTQALYGETFTHDDIWVLFNFDGARQHESDLIK